MKIRIVKTPTGQAPEHVRREWLGIVLEAIESDGFYRMFTIGVKGGTADPANIGGYRVPAQEAIDALRKKATSSAVAAAEWFDSNLIDHRGDLVFGKTFCEIIKS